MNVRDLVAITLLLWGIHGCGDNAYDGVNGLTEAPMSSSFAQLSQINSNVLRHDSQTALNSIKSLQEGLDILDANISVSHVASVQNRFVTFMKVWKSVEALYIAGMFDTTMVDTAYFADQFDRDGKRSDTAALMETVINGSSAVETMMYQTVHRSITALEYLLYGSNAQSATDRASYFKSKPRAVDAAIVAAGSIRTYVEQIYSFYSSFELIESDATVAMERLTNKLIDSAYKLKETRTGDPAGMTVKYKDLPDASRCEFMFSKSSLEAVRSILQAHKKLLDSGFEELAKSFGAGLEIARIRLLISEALSACDAFSATLEDEIATVKAQTLYTKLVALYEGYYFSLINALSLTADIIEADGD